METYANLGGDSGITKYETGDDYIIVEFKPSKYTTINFYKYTYASAGNVAIEHMKTLANQGQGLNSYISKNKPSFISKSSTLAGL